MILSELLNYCREYDTLADTQNAELIIFQVGYTEMGETLKGVFQWK